MFSVHSPIRAAVTSKRSNEAAAAAGAAGGGGGPGGADYPHWPTISYMRSIMIGHHAWQHTWLHSDIVSLGPQHSHWGGSLKTLETSTCSMPGIDKVIHVYNTTVTPDFFLSGSGPTVQR